MEEKICREATTLLLTAMKQEKQAQADQLKAIVSLAKNYTATFGTAINDDLLDELVEDTATGGSFGTAPISEFAAMELGPLIGCSPARARTILFETLNLFHRHPSLWAAVQGLTLDAHRARKAAGKLGALAPELAEKAGRAWAVKQHRLSWQGAIDLCDKLIVAADPDIAAEREARQLRDRDVRIWEHHEATINLTAKMDPLDAKYVDKTVAQIATILREQHEYRAVASDVLRSKALGIMAHPAVALALLQGALQQPIFETPQPTGEMLSGEGGEALPAATAVVDPDTGTVNPDPHHCLGHVCGTITVPIAKLQPRVQIYIHLNPAEGTADIEGIGTIAIATLKEVLDGKQIKATPVIDLNTMPAEHQHRPSSRLREAAQLLFPKEAFPFSNRSSRKCDLDHTEAFRKSSRDAQTRIGNLGPFSRRPHNGKTAGFWKCRQPVIGELLWTSPLGFRYIVDKDGTRRLE